MDADSLTILRLIESLDRGDGVEVDQIGHADVLDRDATIELLIADGFLEVLSGDDLAPATSPSGAELSEHLVVSLTVHGRDVLKANP